MKKESTAEIHRTRNAQFRFKLKAANGEPIATSETYTSKAMCLKTARKHFPGFVIVDKTK